MQRESLDLDSVSPIERSAWGLDLGGRDVLLVEFRGRFGEDGGGWRDAAFMRGTLLMALTCWPCEALILDLRSLGDSYGDNMAGVLVAGEDLHRLSQPELLAAAFGELALEKFETCAASQEDQERPRQGVCPSARSPNRAGLTAVALAS